jgi:predicted small lipoprotein YifL
MTALTFPFIIRSMKNMMTLLILVFFLGLLSGCGQTGPLYRPANDQPQQQRPQ